MAIPALNAGLIDKGSDAKGRMAQRRIARGVRGEKRGSAGEAVTRLHREQKREERRH